MRHLLFEQAETWSKDGVDLDAELTKLAEQLPLDMPAFLACFHGREGLERVLQDLYDAQGVVQQTPTFILLQDGKGAVTRGAKSATAFASLLEARLKTKAEVPEEKDEVATQDIAAEEGVREGCAFHRPVIPRFGPVCDLPR